METKNRIEAENMQTKNGIEVGVVMEGLKAPKVVETWG